MAKPPGPKKLRIERAIEGLLIESEHRPYLGCSQLGHECMRKLWYDFRCVKNQTISPRANRLFQRGHREEPIVIADLRKTGVKVHSDQKEIVLCEGHCKGHCDGIAENIPDAPATPHLLEIKTCSEKHFSSLKKLGVEKKFPLYYSQMVIYMDGLRLKRALFIAVNKNTDERYYKRIPGNKAFAEKLKEKALFVVSSEEPLYRLSNNPDYFQCKWCDYRGICHQGEWENKHCRTCEYGDLYNKGVWKCGRTEEELSFKKQLKGCEEHQFLKALL
jgi:hypothetical protein